MMNHTELMKLKQQIETAEKQAAQLEGQKKYLLQQLKEQFGCSSLKEAEKKLEELDKEIEQKSREFTAYLAEISKRYEA